MRLELRESTPLWLAVAAPAFAVSAALALASLLILWAGAPIADAFGLILAGAAGSRFALTETLARAIPLVLTGLAAALAFRARFWNIGAEGQLYAGALGVTAIGTGLVALPPVLMVPLLVVAGAAAGAAAIVLPWFLRARLGVDEVVTTLLLNFVILLIVSYCLEGPLKDPMSLGWPQAAPIVDAGRLPALVERTRLHAGLWIALALAAVVWATLRYSAFGFRLRALGMNADAARHAGVRAAPTLLAVALASGALAGVAGYTEVAGLKGYLTLDLSPGFGYTGIAVAMLASLHPLGVVAAAVFLAGLAVGADSMGRALGVPSYIADITVAAAVLAMLVGLMLARYRVRRR